MSPRKYVPLTIGALLLVALLLIPFSRNTSSVSIGKPDGSSPIQPQPGVLEVNQQSSIHVNVSLPPEQYRQLIKLNQNFMMKYPNIQVKLTNEASRERAYEQWALQSQQREAPDVMLLESGWVKPFAVRGFLQSVDSILTGDALTDQMASLLDPLRWNGYLWGVPKDVNPYIVVWNHHLLEQAGLTSPPADFAAYQELSAKVLELDAETSILNWSAGDLIQQLIWMAMFQPEQSNIINARPLNETQTSQLKWMETMSAGISRIEVEDSAELNEAFRENKLLAAVIPWDAYEGMTETTRDGLIVDRQHIYFPWLNGRSYVISSNSEFQEEAMLWIQEMTDINTQQQTYDLSGLLPAKASLYTFNSSSGVEQGQIPPAWWKKVLDEKQQDDQLPFPDPFWPEKWLQLEKKWKLFSKDTFEISNYIGALDAT